MTPSAARPLSSALVAGTAAGLVCAAGVPLAGRLPEGWRRPWARSNYRGSPVTLLGGPAYAAAALAGIGLVRGLEPEQRLAAAVAVAAAAALGAYDDVRGSGTSRGLRGHAAALRRGELTTGAVKVVGIGAAGLLAGRLLHRSPVDAALAAMVVAGAANAVNLLDLRPGRALKAGLLLSVPALHRGGASAGLATAAAGAALGALPGDLCERSMLGDAGANALGALVGVALVVDADRTTLVAQAVAFAGITLLSERVSFTKVIAATPGLRHLDELGRRTA